MAKQYVRELEPGVRVRSVFIVVEKQLLPFRDPSKGSYLSLVLADKTGTIEAKIWEGARDIDAWLEEESLVRVTGVADVYRGVCQVNVSELVPVSDQEVDLKDLLPSVDKDVGMLLATLDEKIESVSNPVLAEFLGSWFSEEDFRKAFATAPAAKRIHHSYLGGLLEHSLEVCRISELCAEMFRDSNRDLLVAGSLLHDVGKVLEYRYLRTIDITTRGRLLGHTVMGYEMVRRRAERHPGFPEGLLTHLGHLILSHHGEGSYGAPVVPQTVEAAVLHYSDLLSSKVKQFSQVVERSTGNRWTSYEKTLGRRIYTGGLEETTEQ